MRVKQLWVYLPLPAKLKLMWDRLTFSRLTTAYFIFSLLHCFIQLGLQVRAFTINANAASFLYSISWQAGAVAVDGFPALGDDLRICKQMRPDLSTEFCDVVWNGKQSASNATNFNKAASPPQSSSSTSASSSSSSSTSTGSSTVSSSTVAQRSSTVSSQAKSTVATSSSTDASSTSSSAGATKTPTPIVVNNAFKHDDDDDEDDESDDESTDKTIRFDSHHHRRSSTKSEISLDNLHLLVIDANGNITVNIDGGGYHDETVSVSKSCVWSLNWPVSILDNTKREDIVFIAFQIWVMGMSLVALLNESIPHIFASLLTHILSTVWSGYQIQHTANFRSQFARVITNGACSSVPVPFLGNYWNLRALAEYITLAFNIVSLFISAYLTWKLVKLFGWQTFKRVGASITINRLYKIVLFMSIILQLSLFFVGATVGLWIDNLFNGVAATTAWYVPLYKGTAFTTMLLSIPWIISGWVSIRKEKRVLMFVFLVLSILYLGGWSVMFLSDTFRWTFLTWMFFRIMAVFSVVLTTAAFVLGVICRFNFGKGLPRYLSAHEPLPGDDFTPVNHPQDLEKVDFPSNDAPIPTFSAAFGRGTEVPPPSQMFPSRVGPRFFQRSAVPFETSTTSSVTAPSAAVTRNPSADESYMTQGTNVARSDTMKSYGSLASYYSYGEQQHNRSDSIGSKKRWVIDE